MDRTMTPEHRVWIAEGVATLTLERPSAYNALTASMLDAVNASFVKLERDDTVRAIVLTGSGRGFCAGQALDDPGTFRGNGAEDLRRALVERYNPLVRKLLTIEKPVIAAVNGPAAGAGMGIALACDMRLAVASTSFSTAFVKIGLVPDSALSYLLPRMIGYGRALEAAMLSEKIDARKALELGIVNRICEDSTLLADAQALAKEFARKPSAIGLIKRQFVRNALGDLDAALEYETEMQTIAAQTEDFAEGLDAFRNKRMPAFAGR